MPFGNRFLIKKLREEEAFGIVEALMALTILSLVLVALLGLLMVSVKAVASSKLSTTATQVANQCIEDIRALPYGDVGILESEKSKVEPYEPADNIPTGSLKAVETQTVSGIEFTIKYKVVWVDDSQDGLGSDDTDTAGPKDYKQVMVNIHWIINETTKTASASTFVKDKSEQTQPPTVVFTGDTPPDGTMFSINGDDTYEDMLNNGQIPLKAKGTDEDKDLITMRFYASGITPEGGFYRFDATDNFENVSPNSPCYWNPNATDTAGSLYWMDGTHEIVVEVWDGNGLRDAKSIFWQVDRFGIKKEGEPVEYQKNKYRVTISWKALQGMTVSYFDVYRDDVKINASAIPGEAESYTFTDDKNGLGLTSGSTYNYKVLAYNGSGQLINQSIVLPVTISGKK